MMDRFVRGRRGRPKVINVVSQGFEVSLEHVAIAGAETALRVIKDLAERTTNAAAAVHVGFGAGSTMMLVARYLAERLRAEVTPPRVVLHALTSGFSVVEPANAPVAFFNLFHGIPGVSYRGLFAPAFVAEPEWEKTLENVGVRESVEEKDKLQVVITSLASRKDEHGELNRFMAANAELGSRARHVLDDQQGRVGDVMYRPFSERGPITHKTDIRAVTLFELQELVRFAAETSKAVILVAGPCGAPECRRSRSDALLPLLQEPSLDVWSHLVTDDVTAVNCLNGAALDAPGPSLKTGA
jgi:DNA-binding transcriptional regulator LsrR (DeoR family)